MTASFQQWLWAKVKLRPAGNFSKHPGHSCGVNVPSSKVAGMKATSLVTLVVLSSLTVRAHDWHRHEDPQFANLQSLTLTELAILAEEQLAPQEFAAAVPVQFALADAPATQTTATQPAAVRAFLASFTPFAPKVKTRWDERFFYVESDGLPAHNMMVGITAWQQQVPLPQSYVGENAWRIPLHPVVSKQPVSIRGRFLRGAIALAANGIPIFNPQNNRGEVSQEIGELDQWGGHCGRADDYHYHAAPFHLQATLGKALPIAFALDGYPIYGLAEPDGSAPTNLDSFNGHEKPTLGYHYHGSTKYPYVNGGFHGEVVEVGGQVDPQPRAQSLREAGAPLRGAKITGFTAKTEKSYSLKYEVGTETRYVNYTLKDDKSVKFDFVDGRGEVRTENYTPRQRGPGGGGERQGGPGGPRPDGNGQGRPRPGVQREGGRPGDRAAASPARSEGGAGAAPFILNAKRSGNFVLHSSVVADGGALPVEFTGDGAGVAPPIDWTGAPAGTKSLAVVMDHLAPGNEMKCYWTMWDIPANLTSLPKDARNIGRLGPGFKGALGYEPPHSQGPGLKTYTIHVYALSAAPQFSQPQREVTREVLLAAIKDSVLDSAELKVTYTRPGTATPGRPFHDAVKFP